MTAGLQRTNLKRHKEESDATLLHSSSETSQAAVNPSILVGKEVILTHFQPSDAKPLWDCFGGTKGYQTLAKYFTNTHLMKTSDDFGQWLIHQNQPDTCQGDLFHTMIIRDAKSKEPMGMASYMSFRPHHGSVEIGCVCHSIQMQQSKASTEAHYLLAKHVFDDCYYRRYEWRLNNANDKSHYAARRLGFTFEGIFRNHMMVVDPRNQQTTTLPPPLINRDTAWYSITDDEWPICKQAFEIWLSDNNFDRNGKQRQSLSEIREKLQKENQE